MHVCQSTELPSLVCREWYILDLSCYYGRMTNKGKMLTSRSDSLNWAQEMLLQYTISEAEITVIPDLVFSASIKH